MKFLIIAGPYEADLFRRAAFAAQIEALAIEPGDSLSGWIAAARPDLIVLSAQGLEVPIPAVVSRIRLVPGGDVPLVILCDDGEVTAVNGLCELALSRPTSPEALVSRARELVRKRRATQPPPAPEGEGSGPKPSEALTRPGSEPSARVVPAAVPELQPLAIERPRTPSHRPAPPVANPPWLRDIAASIDLAIDAEMSETLHEVTDVSRAKIAVGEAVFPARDEQTLEVPRELVHTILSDARHLLGSREGGAGAWAGHLPGAGELEEHDLPTLLGVALQEGITGRLRVRRGEVEKSIFFEAGRPVLAVSNASADRMVQMLVRNRTLSAEQAARAVEVATESGRRMGAVLVDLGFIKSSELLPAVRQHYEEIIFSLFSWSDGHFRLELGATADPRRVRLLQHPAALVLEGLGRCYDDARLRAALGADEQVLRLESHAGAPDILLEIGGNDPALGRLPVLFDGVRTLAEVIRIAAQPPEVVRQIALTLRVFGLLRSPRRGEALGPMAEPAVLRDKEIDRERIRGRLKLVSEGTYYELLGVGPEASVAEVEQAFEKIMRELSDAAVGPELARELAVELAEIRSVLEEARTILTDADLGVAYRANYLEPAGEGDAGRARAADAAPRRGREDRQAG